MGVLAAVAVAGGLAVTACYAPAVRDCTVSCGSPDDCAAGQVCGSDGKCAAPDVAGRCAAIAPDAGAHDPGGGRPDAAPSDDASDAGPADGGLKIRLAVQVSGKGSVVVEGRGICSTQDPQRGNCAYDVAVGALLTVRAVAIDEDQRFAMWTSPTCAGQGARCVFTPVFPTTVSARFAKTALQASAP